MNLDVNLPVLSELLRVILSEFVTLLVFSECEILLDRFSI